MNDFEISRVIKAYIACRRHKRVTGSALSFEISAESNLVNLYEKLKNHTYQPRDSICFAVQYPKPREIFAGHFTDRVVHHLLVEKIENIFESRFIYHSFACRKKKGAHLAVKVIKKSLNKITKNRTSSTYYGKFDIKSFFCSIDKKILFQLISKTINNCLSKESCDEILHLAAIVIFHDPTKNYCIKGNPHLLSEIPPYKSLFGIPKGKGLAIGNLTSQFFANVYLNELDQYAKRTLKIKYYFRYVDDIVILSKNREQIKYWQDKIDDFLKKRLKLQLHPEKTRCGSIYQGIEFVGQFIKPTHALFRKRTVKNFKKKLYLINQGMIFISNNQIQKALPLSAPPSPNEIKQIRQTVNSYYGLLRHANCYNLRKNLYDKHFGILKKYLKPVNNYSYFEIKNPPTLS